MVLVQRASEKFHNVYIVKWAPKYPAIIYQVLLFLNNFTCASEAGYPILRPHFMGTEHGTHIFFLYMKSMTSVSNQSRVKVSINAIVPQNTYLFHQFCKSFSATLHRSSLPKALRRVC